MAKGKKKTAKKTTTEAKPEVEESPAIDALKAESSGNEFKVPKDQWSKWSKKQRGMFNDLYSAMMRSPSLFNSHPQAPTIEPDQWRTIAWNAAWNAACV